jgi:RNA polymerase sigma-70 factor (ECF subfamily)
LVHPSAEEFERFALPHAAAALGLARALARNDADAEDVVQEAFMRAFQYFGGYSGGNPRAWLLSIVRNAGYALLRRRGAAQPVPELDADGDSPSDAGSSEVEAETPESLLARAADAEAVHAALGTLPPEFREVVVLRELEQCSYKEIAEIAHIPIGTVMSRLSRGRRLLQERLAERAPLRAAR